MSSLGVFSVLSTVTTQMAPTESFANLTMVKSPRSIIRRYLYGLHEKTKRTLAEEAECGDEVATTTWIKDGTDPNEIDAYGYTPLLNASALGRVCAIRQLVKSNADINRKGPFGFTPLHAAAQNGHRECVQILLDNGADFNAQNEDMDTPLHLALATQQIDIAYLLLRSGSNVFIKGFMDKDCVQTALDARLVELAKFLEKYGLCKKHHNSISY